MGRIIQYDQQTSASGAGLGPGPTGAGRGISALGEALQTVSDNDTKLKVDQIQHSWELADATAKSLGELEQFRQSLAADDDFDSHAPKFQAKAQEIEEQVKSRLGNGTMLYGIWKQDFRRAAQVGNTQVAIESQKLKTAKVQADLGNTLQDLSSLTGLSPEVDDIVRAQARIAIEANAAAGNLDYTQRNTLINKFDQDSAEASIRRDILSDPELAEKKLAAGMYPKLTGEQQAIWAGRITSAAEARQRRAIAEEDHAMRRAEHQIKLAGDEASKVGDLMLAQGGLTPAWVEANRRVLDPADYRYFQKALSGEGDAPSDPTVYVDLRDRAGRGEDVRDEARKELHSGRLRKADLDKIYAEVETSRSGWYKQGKDYLTAMSGYSEINPTIGAAQDKAAMHEEWAQWADAHKNATAAEASRAYQDIATSHQLADKAVKLFTLPKPRFLVGERDKPDIDATEDATMKALKEGRITEDEAAQQALILRAWRKTFTENPK